METFKDNISKLERLTRRERLGELLLRAGLIKLDTLVNLMSEHKYNVHGPFGEFLVDKNYINRKQLLNILNQQKNQDRVIDSCLEKLGFMTNAQKWEALTRCEKLGEILVKYCHVGFSNLIKCIEIQEHTRPERLLGDIMLEEGVISNSQMKKALEFQHLQQDTINKALDELMIATQLPINIKIRRINSMWISF